MKYYHIMLLLFFFSCEQKKNILLPKTGISVINNVTDHSPIYIFFKVDSKDTIAEVNRKNSIISTNWIFNIDKRLPLKLVIPEVIKLQAKKRGDSAHKNEKAENYFSYADSVHNTLAFLPFTNIYYKTGKPTEGFLVYFKKDQDSVLVNNNVLIKTTEVVQYYKNIDFAVNPRIVFLFDKNMPYEQYIENKIIVRELDSTSPNKKEEFIF